MTNYTNRYGDQYKFELMPNGNIMWTGKFEWCRWGMPNVYDKAYAKYQEDGGKESLEVFKQKVHEWDDLAVGWTEFAQKYGQYVYSDKDTIDMVDPSGGPYLSRGMNLKEFFGKDYEDLIIESIKIGKNNIKFKIK